MCGKSLYCGCFGMPQTESIDTCGCPPRPCFPKCIRPPKKGCKRSQPSCKDNNIVCYVPKQAGCCKHSQPPNQQCSKNRGPNPMQFQCVKFPKTPGCVPMQCEPMPGCPDKFICRPVSCPRTKTKTKTCKRKSSPPPCKSNAASCPPPCPPPPCPQTCPPQSQCSNQNQPFTRNQCELDCSWEEFKQKIGNL